MVSNRIAVYGHRGWASSAIVSALAKSCASVTVLYRPGSDVSRVPESVKLVEVDVEDQVALQNALQDIDIVISLVGHEGVKRQRAFIRAIPHTRVKLFVPSDLGVRCDSESLLLPVNQAKREVEMTAKEAGIPTTIILPGFFAESTLCIGLVGIDLPGNRIIFSGNSQHEKLNLCTKDFVAAAYGEIFSTKTPAELENRIIGLSELQVTGDAIAEALEIKHGSAPEKFSHSLDEIEKQIRNCLNVGNPLAMAWDFRRIWGAGKHVEAIGTDIWEVNGYDKANLKELVLAGEIAYREPNPQLTMALDKTFFH